MAVHDVMLIVMRIVITFCAAMLTAAIVPWFKRLCHDARYKSLVETVKTAVMAAEQTITGSGMGTIKKDEVTAFLSEWLLDRGYSISVQELNELIEAAVYGLKAGEARSEINTR